MEHIDVLPRIIEPSMMANFVPKEESNAHNETSVIPTQNEKIETDVPEQSERKPSFLQSKFMLLKENLILILIIISVMVVIYVVYKFYFYRKNESKRILQNDSPITKPFIPKPQPFTKIEETGTMEGGGYQQPHVQYIQEVKESDPHDVVQDANKYVSLDQYNDSDEESNAMEETIDALPTSTHELNQVSFEEKESFNTSSEKTYDYSSKFEHMNLYDADQSDEETSNVATINTEIDIDEQPKNIIQEVPKGTQHISNILLDPPSIPPITVSPSQMDRDIHTILNDIKNDDLSNPFMINTFIPTKEETESVVSHTSIQSGFSENRSEKMEEFPSETEEEKKRPKKVTKRSTRVLKIRNKD